MTGSTGTTQTTDTTHTTDGPTDTTGSDTPTGTDTGTSDTWTTTGDAGHGITRVELQIAGDENPFPGTTEARVTMHYNQCLEDWYENAGMDYRQEGIKGEVVFERFADDLCDREDSQFPADCEVISIEQDDTSMTVKYRINDTELEGKEFLWGPVPCESLSGCSAPTVEVTGRREDVQGFDAEGLPLWEVAGLSQPHGSCDQGAPVTVRVEPI